MIRSLSTSLQKSSMLINTSGSLSSLLLTDNKLCGFRIGEQRELLCIKHVVKIREKENTTGFLSSTRTANIIVFINMRHYNMNTIMMNDRGGIVMITRMTIRTENVKKFLPLFQIPEAQFKLGFSVSKATYLVNFSAL